MAKKEEISAAVEAPLSGAQLEASDILPETHIARLKTLNGVLLKNTVENREEIHKLRSEISSLAADNEILDATSRDVFKLVLSSSLSKKAESATAELNAARMRFVDMSREKEGLVKERDLVRSDFEERRKEMEGAYALLLEEKKVADCRCRKLEEELQSARLDEDLCLELVREMEAKLSRKDEDVCSLKAEIEENVSKISVLEEECRLLKEIRGKLENEVCDMKEEKAELVASYEEIKTSYLKIEEEHKRSLTKLGRLEKEKFDSEKAFDVKQKEMSMQINELKGNIAKMAAEEILVDQRCANHVIQIGKLQAELSELQSARKSLEDAHRSCSEKIARKDASSAAVQRERDLKAEEAVALTMRLHESMKAKHIVELKLEQIHKQLNHLTTENEETKKHMNSLMYERALLETVLETSKQELQGIEKKLKTLKDASGQVFFLLKRITDEVMDEERTQENCTSREIGLEIENDEEMKLSVENLEVIKLAMKAKDTKIKDLNQELELLQLSAAYAKNKRAIWKWLFPAATTIFAAVSLAYAARAR